MIVTENYTKIPNQYFELMPEMKGSVAKLVLAFLHVLAKTNNDYAFLSYTDFEELTGLRRNTVNTALKESLQEKYLAILPEYKSYQGKSCYIMGEQLDNDEEINLPDISDLDITKFPKSGQYVYLIQGIHNYYKIGKTNRPQKRIRRLSIVLPFDIDVIHLIETNDMTSAENYLHEKYQDKRVRGEWFKLSPADVAEIKDIESIEVTS